MGMADGGLAALPVPDMMFDEPTGGEFAGGGIVAFAGAGPVGVPDDMQILRDQMAYFNDPERQKADFYMGGQPKREASERLREFYSGALSEEGQKKRRDEDKWFALAQLGATMAGTPGSLLQAAGAGVKAALPGLQESSKERRAEQREAIKQLALDEGATNAEAREVSKAVMEGRLKATDIGRTLAEIKSREGMTEKEIASRERISASEIRASRENAKVAAAARQTSMSDLETMLYIMEKGTPEQKAAMRQVLQMKQQFAPSALAGPLEVQKARAYGLAFPETGQGGGNTVDLGFIQPPKR
jgi:hypothetical protein